MSLFKRKGFDKDKVQSLIKEIESELVALGYRNTTIEDVPDVITRVEITLRMAHLHYFGAHPLQKRDKFWCDHYSHYVHFFDSDKLDRLGSLYYDLTEMMEKDDCFNGKAK